MDEVDDDDDDDDDDDEFDEFDDNDDTDDDDVTDDDPFVHVGTADQKSVLLLEDLQLPPSVSVA